MDLSDDLIPVVTQVTVEAHNKVWGQESRERGTVGATTITWTLIPNLPGRAWTRAQAKVVTLLARKELQRLLLMDAMARGAPAPDVGTEALPGYDQAMAELQKANGDSHG
jgi:hypothetical protein